MIDLPSLAFSLEPGGVTFPLTFVGETSLFPLGVPPDQISTSEAFSGFMVQTHVGHTKIFLDGILATLCYHF